MKVLVTGFAGTLGGEFTRQLLEQGHEVVGVDNNEWAVAAFPDMDRLTKRLSDIMRTKVPDGTDFIIHCAAYKHVDLIEGNKFAAHLNNEFATRKLHMMNDALGAKFLFVSTDKSVEPTSYYGQTKLRGEEITKDYGGIIVRLGNIKGSNGSVIPKWEACADKGEPLPVTDPEMTRYMIPVDEAVRKILALLPHASPGQVIIPSMGEPIKLGDMVKDLFPNAQIKVIGKRPGEKMHEKLKWDHEKTVYKDDNGEIVQ